jgi:hypothetical protein
MSTSYIRYSNLEKGWPGKPLMQDSSKLSFFTAFPEFPSSDEVSPTLLWLDFNIPDYSSLRSISYSVVVTDHSRQSDL